MSQDASKGCQRLYLLTNLPCLPTYLPTYLNHVKAARNRARRYVTSAATYQALVQAVKPT